MTEARKKILDAIDANRDKAIKFLQDMVAIPSVKSRDELKKHPGYIPVEQGYEGRPNIVATWKGTGGGRSLLLNGHTDVIPVGNGPDSRTKCNRLCEPDLHVFAKLFEDRLERGLEAQALSGREIGGDDDVLNFFVGHLIDVDLTRQPAS